MREFEKLQQDELAKLRRTGRFPPGGSLFTFHFYFSLSHLVDHFHFYFSLSHLVDHCRPKSTNYCLLHLDDDNDGDDDDDDDDDCDDDYLQQLQL